MDRVAVLLPPSGSIAAGKLTRGQVAARFAAVLPHPKFSSGVLFSLGILSTFLGGCAHAPQATKSSDVHALQQALAELAPTVRADEAKQVAATAYDQSRILAEKYRVVWPPFLHNYLVNSGYRERGLCYDWAEDLLAQLQLLGLESLQLRWGIARAATAREHNSIVVTARDQPFARGIVLDPWRRSGRLVWIAVAADRYPWVEGELHPSPPAVTPR